MRPKLERISFREYCARDAVNNSRLKKMGKSALAYKENVSQYDTAALSIGRPIHTRILEPLEFDQQYIEWKGGETAKGDFTMSKNSTAFKLFKMNADNNGCEVLDAKQIKLCDDMADAVSLHPEAMECLANGKSEVSVSWQHRLGPECKIRVDMLQPDRFVDLKSAHDISPSVFGRAALKYEYHVQGAFYQDGLEALTGNRLPFYIVAIEKVYPYDLVVYHVPDAILDIGRSIYEDRLLRVKQCTDSGIWPGVCSDVATLEFPDWAYTEHLDAAVSWEGIEVIK